MASLSEQQIRLWPGAILVGLQWLIWLGAPLVMASGAATGMLGGAGLALLVLVWWLFFSRVPMTERLGAVILMVLLGVAARRLILDPSIAGGMMGMMYGFFVLPGLSLALVAWAAVSGATRGMARRAALVVMIALACGVWGLARTEGLTGEGRSQFKWRWSKDSEQKLLARVVTADTLPVALPAPPAKKVAVDEPSAKALLPPPTLPVKLAVSVRGVAWPGFRGPRRDGVVRGGRRIKTDWAATPPLELWRREIGPGWSSFAVGVGLIYTQEQRGEHEVVSCYEAATGKPVWVHRDTARFWESNGGAGPRGTPALHGGRVYTMGATGIVNALDAATGAVAWRRNAALDTGAKLPGWGFASSPLIVDDVVVVAAAGRLAAYASSDGTPRWVQHEGGGGYSSPQLLMLGDRPQALFSNDVGVTSYSVADGALLWRHAWDGGSILQPGGVGDGGGVLIASNDMSGGMGVRRLRVGKASGGEGWAAEEVWTSKGLKPYFNDFVVHDGHVYGFDAGILACIDLADGKRNWKGGRYGHGQMLLLADAGVLLVLSEEGEVALVAAAPGEFKEVTRMRAMDGKTWNHPVVVGDLLLVRNGAEMVAYRLPTVE